MGKKSWHLNRRIFLRGLGVTAMLPYLEAMGRPLAKFEEQRPKRLCYVYFPNGVGIPPIDNPHHRKWSWFPLGEGKDYQFTRTLSSLEPHRQDISILGGLSHPKSRHLLGHLAGDTWLTGGDLRGSAYNNSISADQIAAQTIGKVTRYPNLSLSTDGGIGYKSRVSTLSFDLTGKPIPSEHRHREIFERYFTPGGGTPTNARRKSLQQGLKLVDLLLEDSKSFNRRLGTTDQQKLDEYMTSLGQVEDQVRRNEQWLDVPMKSFNSDHLNFNANAAVNPEEYLRTTYDLIVLAFKTDITRVVTYMKGREDGMGFGENFPKLALGLKLGHHAISHDLSEGHWEEWGRYDQWLTKQFSYFIDQLKNTEDEYGSLLDNTLTLYGSACSTTHDAINYPLVLAGGKNMGIKHGNYTKYDEHVPMSNLLLTMLNTVGIQMDQFSDSTGTLPEGVFS
ncbi:MAG: DUF1552 domain-containing protein [Cyclobacteriaceae bacterium]